MGPGDARPSWRGFRTARRGLSLGALATLNLLLAFVGQWLVFFVLGVGEQTDALYASLALPQVVALFLSTPVTGVLVPQLAGLGATEARTQASSAMLATLLVSGPVMVVLYLSAPVWTSVLLPGFRGEAHARVVELAQIHVFGAFAHAGFGVVWASVLARERLVAAEASQVVSSALSSAAIYPAAQAYGVEGVAWVLAFRSASRTLFALPFSFVRPTFRLRGANLRRVVRRSFPLSLSWLYRSTEELIDNYLLSMAPVGSVSLLNLAKSLYNAGLGVLNKSVLIPLSARFGILVKKQQLGELGRQVRRYRLGLVVFAFVGFGVLVVVGRPALALLIGHGGVTPENVQDLWMFVIALGGMLWGLNAAGVVAMAFNALGMTKLNSVVSACAYTLGVGFKIGGFWAFGALGLAVGTSVYQSLAALLVGIVFARVLTQEQGSLSREPA